jgi:hypothetical protein
MINQTTAHKYDLGVDYRQRIMTDSARACKRRSADMARYESVRMTAAAPTTISVNTTIRGIAQ